MIMLYLLIDGLKLNAARLLIPLVHTSVASESKEHVILKSDIAL